MPVHTQLFNSKSHTLIMIQNDNLPTHHYHHDIFFGYMEDIRYKYLKIDRLWVSVSMEVLTSVNTSGDIDIKYQNITDSQEDTVST